MVDSPSVVRAVMRDVHRLSAASTLRAPASAMSASWNAVIRPRGAPCVRVVRVVSPSSTKRARGMPGAGRTHGPPAKKNAGGRYHRFSRDIPAFPARWLGGLYVLSPGTGCLAPVTNGSSSPSAWPQHREARTLRFRRRIGLVRPHDCSRCDPMHPPHPAPTSRDDREAPLMAGRDAHSQSCFSEKRKWNIFRGRTGQG